MDALNILDAVRDPIVYSQKIGTAQGGKELNLMICMNMNINSGKSEEIFPPANCARHTCCSHLPTSCAAIINADVIYHHFMCSYSVIVAGYQPGGIKFFLVIFTTLYFPSCSQFSRPVLSGSGAPWIFQCWPAPSWSGRMKIKHRFTIQKTNCSENRLILHQIYYIYRVSQKRHY